MIHKLDYNKDGKVNFLDAAAYLTNLCGPYLIIVLGVLAPDLANEFRGTLVTLGAGLAGTAQKEEKRQELSRELLDATISAAVNKARNELNAPNQRVPSYTMPHEFSEFPEDNINDGTDFNYEDGDSGEPVRWS